MGTSTHCGYDPIAHPTTGSTARSLLWWMLTERSDGGEAKAKLRRGRKSGSETYALRVRSLTPRQSPRFGREALGREQNSAREGACASPANKLLNSPFVVRFFP